MYDKTITLFNRKAERNGSVWYSTVLRNVDLNTDKASILAKYGASSQDKAVLHVRYQNIGGRKMVGEKPWLPPTEWSEQPVEALSKVLTFASGNEFDFFWHGEWTDTEPIRDADYTDGFYNYMSSKYDFVFAVSSVAGPYSVIPHFEIMGK